MKTQAPPLGARIKAIGYLVRYSTYRHWRQGFEREESGVGEPGDQLSRGARGWKRSRCSFDGVYIGRRVLKIKWWWRVDVGTEWEDRRSKAAAYITVYLVAYNVWTAPRYVLPRDAEVV